MGKDKYIMSGGIYIISNVIVQKKCNCAKILHNLSKSNSCGENFDKLRKILLISLCFGANYQNFVWKKD